MYQYIFQPNRELLELNAMEMDDGLIHFFYEAYGWEDARETTELEFVNEQSVVRKLKVNMYEAT